MPETALNGGWAAEEGERAASDTRGDPVERAVRDHARLVYRVAHAVLRNRQDAEDATQEVFLKVLRLRRDLEGVRDARTWLARIAFRVALDRRPRRRHLSLDDSALSADVASLGAGGAGADELASSRQVQALLEASVAALPEELRAVVQLSTLEELSSPEVAGLLGIPEGTVRTRLMRARLALREALSAALGARHA